MSNMLSKEVRNYWVEKVRSKFSDRKQDIETENHNMITSISETRYPAFEKALGLGKLANTFKLAEADLQEFRDSKERVETNKENKLNEARDKFIKQLTKWKATRNWSEDLPGEKDGTALQAYMQYLEEVCFDEAKKHFYTSKDGKKMQTVNLQRERAMDILHSDGPKEELLKALSKVCGVVKIPMNVPIDALKITAK